MTAFPERRAGPPGTNEGMTTTARRLRAIACALACGSALTAVLIAMPFQAPRDTAAQSTQQIVIRGGWLFTGVADARVRNTGIVIVAGRFAEVGTNLNGRDLSKSRVIDLADTATILPGMFDLHAHHNMNLVAGGRVDEFVYNPIIYLANGVTSTWPAGEFNPDGMMEARKRIDSGKQVGARIFNSGPYFGRARCQEANDHTSECKAWPNSITEQQIRDQVDYWAERGVRSLKIKLASPNEMRIIVDQAHKHGLTTSSHMQSEDFHQDVDSRDAILMGLDRIEHSIAPVEDVIRGKYPVGGPELKALIDLMLARNVYFDATMRVYGAGTLASSTTLKTHWMDEGQFFTPFMQSLFDKRRQQTPRTPQQRPPGSLRDFSALFLHKVPELKAFFDAGGGRLITVGTDNPTGGPDLDGFAYHRELQAIVYAGIPPVAALKAATINGARALGVSDRLGSIEAGKIADLFVANGNPLDRIEDARQVQLVIKGGDVFDPQALLNSAKGQIGPASETDRSAWVVKER
jgi:imidazolonepropionase-like amidohydrolase